MFFFLFFSSFLCGATTTLPRALQDVDSLVSINEISEASRALNSMDISSFTSTEKAIYAKLQGEVYRIQGEIKLSIETLNRGLRELSFDSKGQITCQLYNELSKATRKSRNLEKAKFYGLKAVAISNGLKCKKIKYKSLTILGNAYHDLSELESALDCYENADEFVEKGDFRAKAILQNNVGNILIEQGEFKKAESVLKSSSELFSKNLDTHNANQSLTAYAYALQAQGKFDFSLEILESALVIANSNNWLDDKLAILQQQREIWSVKKKIPNYRRLQDSITSIEHQLMNKSILEAQEKYENSRLESQLTTERQQRDIARLESQQRSNIIRFLLLGLGALILVGGFYFYNQRLKNKLRISEEALMRTKALEAERTRIAGEMHDDLGGGLTTIRFLSKSVLDKLADTKEKEKLKKIANHAEDLVGNMSEIIWAMNAGFDTLESLIAYTRRFGSEYFADYNLAFESSVKGQAKGYAMTGEQRRNIFLIIKEAFHNITKHAKADKVSIVFDIVNPEQLHISISDNGKGFSGQRNDLGHGLKTMESRISKLAGKISFESSNGTEVKLSLPLAKQERRIT